MRGALVLDSVVVNIIEYSEGYDPPEGLDLIEVASGQVCEIGWGYDQSGFAPSVEAIEKVRARRYVEIDVHTDEMVDAGFTYGGKQFSLSLAAQSKMIGTYTVRTFMTYPLRWNCLDDNDAINLANADDVTNFFLTGVSTVRAILDTGTALKDLVRAANSVNAINAIIDER